MKTVQMLLVLKAVPFALSAGVMIGVAIVAAGRERWSLVPLAILVALWCAWRVAVILFDLGRMS